MSRTEERAWARAAFEAEQAFVDAGSGSVPHLLEWIHALARLDEDGALITPWGERAGLMFQLSHRDGGDPRKLRLHPWPTQKGEGKGTWWALVRGAAPDGGHNYTLTPCSDRAFPWINRQRQLGPMGLEEVLDYLGRRAVAFQLHDHSRPVRWDYAVTTLRYRSEKRVKRALANFPGVSADHRAIFEQAQGSVEGPGMSAGAARAAARRKIEAEIDRLGMSPRDWAIGLAVTKHTTTKETKA